MKSLTIAVVLAIATLAGCVHVDSDDVSRSPTTGQQLIDLAKAHEQGLLSDEEYKRKRADILDDH